MDPSLPIEHSSNEPWKKKKNQECTANNSLLVSNCLMGLPFPIPPFVRGTPFVHQLFFFRTPARTLTSGHNSVIASSSEQTVFPNSMVSALDGCLRKLNEFASQNPLLKNVFSVTSHLHSCIWIPCRSTTRLNLSSHNFAAVLPGDSLAGLVVANGILNFLNIYNTLLVVRLVLTWFPNTPPAIVSPLSTLCDPYLNIFRGIIPPLGGTLDLSPILAFLVLNVFSSTAAALPAELPSPDVSHGNPSHLTTSNKKWMRRLAANRSKNTNSNN